MDSLRQRFMCEGFLKGMIPGETGQRARETGQKRNYKKKEETAQDLVNMPAPYTCLFVVQMLGTSPISDSVNSVKYMILVKDVINIL